MVDVDIQSSSNEPVPTEADLRTWLTAAVASQSRRERVEISLRLVDTEEMSRLNARYRGKQGPTNVLSFPADLPAQIDVPLLGDIVICAPVVRREAAAQGKALDAHWAHMAVHGALHLLGHEHEQPGEADAMEALETDILRQLDFPCPYAGSDADP
ncbi:MAG: rRNA maturation RNase YbeY [Pseudomonadota bacterium]